MIETGTGLVLRTRLLTETSLIVHWLSPTLGRLATVAKGARRPKSPLRGKLDLFYLADFSFQRSRRSDLHTLREVNLRETYTPLRRELGYLQQASYCAALVEQTTEVETPLPGVFDLMKGMLDFLTCQPPRPETVFAFEIRMLHELGLKPNVGSIALSAASKEILSALSAGTWESVARLRLSVGQSAELRRFLHGFLIYHLGRIPQNRNAALGQAESVDQK